MASQHGDRRRGFESFTNSRETVSAFTLAYTQSIYNFELKNIVLKCFINYANTASITPPLTPNAPTDPRLPSRFQTFIGLAT